MAQSKRLWLSDIDTGDVVRNDGANYIKQL